MRIVADEAVLNADIAFDGGAGTELVLLPSTQIDADSIVDADALIVRSTIKIDETLLARHTPKFIATATVGVDHVDLDLMNERGVDFHSAARSSAKSVAQFTLGMAAHLAEKQKRPLASYHLGVVGCGAIGRLVALAGETLFQSVTRVDPFIEGEVYADTAALAACDLVTFHVPLTTNGEHPTFAMINETFLAEWAEGVSLINTARGAIISESALLEAKSFGRLRGLALDVFPNEPTPSQELIEACDLATPHIAGRSQEGMLANTAAIERAFRAHFQLPARTTPDPQEYREKPALTYPETTIDFVRQAWDLESLDQELRRSAASSPESQGKRFRELRKPPHHRDLSSFRIDSQPGPEMQQFLDAIRVISEA